MMTSAIFKWKTVQSLIGRQRCCWFLLDIIWKKYEFGLLFSCENTKNTFFPFCGPPPRVLIVHRWFLLRGTLWHSWSLFLYWVIITDDLGTKIGQERSSECVCMCVCQVQEMQIKGSHCLSMSSVCSHMCVCACVRQETERRRRWRTCQSTCQVNSWLMRCWKCFTVWTHKHTYTHTHTCSQFL